MAELGSVNWWRRVWARTVFNYVLRENKFLPPMKMPSAAKPIIKHFLQGFQSNLSWRFFFFHNFRYSFPLKAEWVHLVWHFFALNFWRATKKTKPSLTEQSLNFESKCNLCSDRQKFGSAQWILRLFDMAPQPWPLTSERGNTIFPVRYFSLPYNQKSDVRFDHSKTWCRSIWPILLFHKPSKG